MRERGTAMTLGKITSVAGAVFAGLICGAGGVSAHLANPAPHGLIALTDNQLDAISAGSAVFVNGSSDAGAAGAFTLTQATGNSFAGQAPSPYPGQPDLGPSAGVVEGTSLAVGTNLGLQGEPPPSSSTSVTTSGSTNGNLVISTTVNQTMHGAGGVTFQVGYTFVYGAWIGF